MRWILRFLVGAGVTFLLWHYAQFVFLVALVLVGFVAIKRSTVVIVISFSEEEKRKRKIKGAVQWPYHGLPQRPLYKVLEKSGKVTYYTCESTNNVYFVIEGYLIPEKKKHSCEPS
jgi:hypothetical protein